VKADTISSDELRRVFLLQRRTLADGSPVAPVLQKSGAHEAFLKQYLNRDSEAIRIYYQGMIFTGKGSMPKELNSDTEVVAYVARTRGAIEYVGGATDTEGVKVLAIAQPGANLERQLITRVEPEYPETLRQMLIGGTVRLVVAISAKGNVEGIQLLGGNPVLAEPAIKAVKQWVYTAGPSRTMQEVNIPFVPK
jgi:TonB family protein